MDVMLDVRCKIQVMNFIIIKIFIYNDFLSKNTYESLSPDPNNLSNMLCAPERGEQDTVICIGNNEIV